MSDAAALRAVVAPAEELDVRWDADAAEAILTLSRGAPYLLQLYADAAWRAAASPDAHDMIGQQAARTGIEMAQQNLWEGRYRGRWNRATTAEKDLLVAVAEVSDDHGVASTADITRYTGRTTPQLSRARDSLLDKGLVEPLGHGRLGLTVPGFERFVRAQTRQRLTAPRAVPTGRLRYMCGRYAASASPGDLVEEFEVDDDQTGGELAPKWNTAPTDTAPVVLERVPRDDKGGEPVRQLRRLVWGLVPSWSKDRKGGARMINARVDSLFDKPGFRRAAVARRALVPADGWYEWQTSPVSRDDKGKPRKQPFFMTRRDGSLVAFAGVYEFWKDRAVEPDDPAAWLTTFAVLTTEAETGLDRVHDRMPVVLDRDRWDAWLDPKVTDPDDIAPLLEPPPVGRFLAVPVSTLVSSVRNDGPELVQPLPVDDLIGVVDPLTGELLGHHEPR